ncbi:hypothetical protein GCM10023322_19910 [Rugosimonospora acidiphila]|uniref:Transglycosylase SLT domain-containing protein n=1 Tax=Rugosimonospora acidiphila TaxID=556531 RepID=A0ABP9RPL9_9ACTN
MRRHGRRHPGTAIAVLAGATILLAGAAGGCFGLTAGDRPSTTGATPATATVRPVGPAHPTGATHPTAKAAPSAPAGPSGNDPTGNDPAGNDPARFSPQVRRYAGQAGIDPQLLMAILYNESYKPHDPAFERAWAKIDPDAAFGIANMHQAAFDDTKRGRDFADRSWQDLPDDPDLAIEAAAWFLHDLAAQLPSGWPAKYTRDDLLALGYNAGAGNMKAFAQGGTPGSVSQDYLNRLHDNWAAAARALG